MIDRKEKKKRIDAAIEEVTYNLKITVSSSSLVLVVTSSVSLMTGSKCGSCSSSV